MFHAFAPNEQLSVQLTQCHLECPVLLIYPEAPKITMNVFRLKQIQAGPPPTLGINDINNINEIGYTEQGTSVQKTQQEFLYMLT